MDNPLISFCLLTYNQEKYIEKAILGALKQNYFPLEIIISDDGSSDGTKEIIKKIVKEYKGKNIVKVNFNDVNVGLVNHFNKIILNQAKGEYILIAAGDDISYPTRTQISYDFIKNKKNTYIADFAVDKIDSNGSIIENNYHRQTNYSDINSFIKGIPINSSGCSRIYKRDIFDIFGPLRKKCPTEDSTSIFRALLLGNLWYSDKKLVAYRIHDSSLSAPNNLFKLNLEAIFIQYLVDLRKARKKGIVSLKQTLQIIRALLFLYYRRKRKNLILRKEFKK